MGIAHNGSKIAGIVHGPHKLSGLAHAGKIIYRSIPKLLTAKLEWSYVIDYPVYAVDVNSIGEAMVGGVNGNVTLIAQDQSNQWTTKYISAVRALAYDDQGNIFLSNITGYIGKYDTNLNQVWSNKILDRYSVAMDIDPDGNAVVGTITGKSVQKVSSDGELLWTTVLGAAIKSVGCASDGSVFVGVEGKLTKLDSGGTESWTHEVSGSFRNIAVTKDAVWVATYKTLYKYDQDGNLLLTLTNVGINPLLTVSHSDQIYLVSHTSSNATQYKRLDKNGDSVWSLETQVVAAPSIFSVGGHDLYAVFADNTLERVSEN